MRVGQMWGGVVWFNPDESDIEKFVQSHWHDGWSLSIFDTTEPGNTIEIFVSDTAEISKIASFVLHQEKGFPISFIGENPLTESYVVAMPLCRGRLNCPGVYRAQNGKLIDISK